MRCDYCDAEIPEGQDGECWICDPEGDAERKHFAMIEDQYEIRGFFDGPPEPPDPYDEFFDDGFDPDLADLQADREHDTQY